MRAYFLSDVGRHVFKLLQQPKSEWTLNLSRLTHRSGLTLTMVPGRFDVADPGLGDSITELSFLDRQLLWGPAKKLRDSLKFNFV